MGSDHYRNSLGDFFYSTAKHEEQEQKLAILQQIANRPATTSALVYIIPVAGIAVFGVIFYIILKRKRQ